MTRPQRRFAIATLASSLCVARALAQSYGNHEQVLTIGAAEFRARIGGDTYLDANGYLYGGADIDYWAPFSLPEGAVIEEICLYADDSDPAGFVLAQVFSAKLVPVGEDPALRLVGHDASSTSNIGHAYYCSEPFSYTVRGRLDDGDGTPDPVAHYVYVFLTSPSQNAVGFGGVRITWRRAVSSPPASPTFGDVAVDDPAFSNVEALRASGITAGCGDGTIYCPDANLTRRQMAVFLAKALGLHWTDTTP